MASSRLRFIDPAGHVMDADPERYDNPDLSSPSVIERVRLLLRRGGWYQVYGLARRDALDRTHLLQDLYGPDVVLVMELAMMGAIVRIPEPLFFFRRHPERTEEARVERQGGVADGAEVLAARMTRLQESLSEAVRRSALPGPMKLRLRAEIIRAAYLADTPMRSRTRREVALRASTAARDGDLRGFAKFALARSVNEIGELPAAGRRVVRRAKKLAAGARRRLR